MCTWKSIFAASLLIALSAVAQQTTTVTPAAEQIAPAAAPAHQAPTVQSQVQPAATPDSTAPAPSPPAPSVAPPTTMDQVVDRAIAREHALMEMLKTRTPLVETYLQNLKLDNQMGPSPVQDHYFFGRIWVEDQDYNIVRLNGTYAPRPRNAYFFHMDSWRLNLVPGYWVPTYIYSEEGDFSYGSKDKMAFKAQTRLWGYNLQKGGKDSELTQVLVDSTVKDESPTAQDASPLQAQRQWQQQAEDNVIERLQNAGLLAPEGEVDKILQTVVTNLPGTNNMHLPLPVRTRVMLTSPLETFSVGQTIIVSRGLIDVLPDEASLAMVLSHELAHIVLGHNLGSKYAFNDRMLFTDESTYQNLGFKHIPEEEVAADKKAMDLLKNSPYSQKLQNAGLFLKQLADRGPALSALLTAHLGNKLTDSKGGIERMAALMGSAPALDPNKLDQIAALPLGGRVRLNAWDDHVELIKTARVAITSARDKMPFEVTPFFPRLTRYGAAASPVPPTAASTAQNN